MSLPLFFKVSCFNLRVYSLYFSSNHLLFFLAFQELLIKAFIINDVLPCKHLSFINYHILFDITVYADVSFNLPFY